MGLCDFEGSDIAYEPFMFCAIMKAEVVGPPEHELQGPLRCTAGFWRHQTSSAVKVLNP